MHQRRLFGLRCQNAFFLQRSNCLGRKRHCYFLTVYHERFFLKIWLKDTLGAPEGEADIVAKLLAFTGEITSCCHSI